MRNLPDAQIIRQVEQLAALVTTAPHLLHEKRYAGLRALIADAAYPVRMHGAGVGAALASDDYPVYGRCAQVFRRQIELIVT